MIVDFAAINQENFSWNLSFSIEKVVTQTQSKWMTDKPIQHLRRHARNADHCHKYMIFSAAATDSLTRKLRSRLTMPHTKDISLKSYKHSESFVGSFGTRQNRIRKSGGDKYMTMWKIIFLLNFYSSSLILYTPTTLLLLLYTSLHNSTVVSYKLRFACGVTATQRE